MSNRGNSHFRIHKHYLCLFGLAGISQVLLSDASQACTEHLAWTLQPSQEAIITPRHP